MLDVRVLCVVVLLTFVGAASSQSFDTGAFVATDSFRNQLCMWNTTSEESFQCGCANALGDETFTPAYDTDTSTRQLIYVKAVSDESPIDKVYSLPYQVAANGTLECGAAVAQCDARGWYTNQTLRIFADGGLGQVVMVDTVYFTDRFYKIRVWKFDFTSCALQFVDSFKTSPLDEMEVGSFSYDAANHRLYTVYIDLHRDTRYRLRSTSVHTSTLNYDVALPMARSTSDVVYSQFDAVTGRLVLVGGQDSFDEGSLQGHLFDPIHFDDYVPGTWEADKSNFGPNAQDMIINWRERLVTYQKGESDGFQQTSFNIADGTIASQWLFTEYVDNGWFYDPLLTIVPVNVNEATAAELASGLPGVSSTLAQHIVNCRNFEGRFPTVDAVFDRVPQVSREDYENFRPWAMI